MSRPDDGGRLIVIVQRAAELLDETNQRRIRDERPRPQLFVQLGLPDDAGCFRYQQRQEIEGFGRQVNGEIASRQLSSARIERKFSESCGHSHVLYKALTVLGGISLRLRSDPTPSASLCRWRPRRTPQYRRSTRMLSR